MSGDEMRCDVHRDQKHACPFAADKLKGWRPAMDEEGKGHQGWNGTGTGTPDFHGASSESTALRGVGWLMAPWAATPTQHISTQTSLSIEADLIWI